MPASIRIVEVGPRDGLQNESTPIPTHVKLEFIQNLIQAGITEIEATSFVSPKWVPQLADAQELWPQLPPGPLYSALVPNEKGLQRAQDLKVNRIAVFTAASDAFTQKNINMSVEQSLESFKQIIHTFRQHVPHGWVRAYVSTAFECPYAGKIDPQQTTNVAIKLLEMNVDEISISDTIGVAVPHEVEILTEKLLKEIPKDRLAYHFHDTRGTAIANVAKALEMGITTFDSSAGGLGGCPYAPGAGGNLATEDLVYFLHRSGIQTNINEMKLAQASLGVLKHLHRAPAAKAQLAILARACPPQ